jgi:hypothetical protein
MGTFTPSSVGSKLGLSGVALVVAIVGILAVTAVLGLAIWSLGVFFWLNVVAGFGLSFWQVVGVAGLAAAISSNVTVTSND